MTATDVRPVPPARDAVTLGYDEASRVPAPETARRADEHTDAVALDLDGVVAHRDNLAAMIRRLSEFLDGRNLNSWKHGACWAAEDAIKSLTARAESAEAEVVTLRAKVAAVEAHPVVLELAEERTRQTAKHGDQSHLPDGTGAALWLSMDDDYIRRHGIRRDNLAAWAKARTDEASQASGDGSITFEHILTEEWAEAIAESDPDALRAELVQVAAVAVQWVEAIDLRAALTANPVPLWRP